MGAARVRVLFIAGSGRSGSTLLDNLLGQVDGFLSTGEVYYFWQRSLVEGRLCGCGRQIPECEFWSVVLTRLAEDATIDPTAMMALARRGTRLRHVPLMLSTRGLRRLRRRLDGYLDGVERLYRSISEVSGASIIVDSSKFPAYGYVLGSLPSIELSILHLVRDSRAVAHSWKRLKLQPDTDARRYMMQRRTGAVAARWTAGNAATELLGRRLGRYRRVRYEDLVADPRGTIVRIMDWLGVQGKDLKFVRNGSVELAVSHTVSGNPSRFRVGWVPILLDDGWRQHLDSMHKLAATSLTWPLLLRYGYLGDGGGPPPSGTDQ